MELNSENYFSREANMAYMSVSQFKAFEKCEAAAKCVIQHCQTSVRSIHHADDMDIARNGELFIRIQQLKLYTTLVILDQHEQFTEDLAEVATIDLVNNEEVRTVIVSGLSAKLIKDAGFQLEAGLGGAIAHNEVFVAVTLMELNHLDTAGIFLTHDGVGQTLSSIGLTNAGGP